MESFETTVTISKDTFQKLKKHKKPPHEKMRVAIASVVLVIVGILYIVLEQMNSVLGIPMISLGLAGPLLHHFNFNYVTKVNWRRAIQSSEGRDSFECITSFTDDEVKLHNPTNGGTAHIKYGTIKRFAETDEWYVLFTKDNQFIIVDKVRLIQEEKDKDFLRFIVGKCENVKWKK